MRSLEVSILRMWEPSGRFETGEQHDRCLLQESGQKMVVFLRMGALEDRETGPLKGKTDGLAAGLDVRGNKSKSPVFLA